MLTLVINYNLQKVYLSMGIFHSYAYSESFKFYQQTTWTYIASWWEFFLFEPKYFEILKRFFMNGIPHDEVLTDDKGWMIWVCRETWNPYELCLDNQLKEFQQLLNILEVIFVYSCSWQ